MTTKVSLILQVVLAACQGINIELLPTKWQLVVGFALALTQGALAWLAHYYNPDGTPAEFTWKDPAIMGATSGNSMPIGAARPPVRASKRMGGPGSRFMFVLAAGAAGALALGMAACSTARPTLFSGKPVVEFDQGQLFLSYIKLNRVYAVFKYQVSEGCAAKAVPERTCAAMADADALVVKAAEEVEQGLVNPSYPVDMQKVQAFIDLTLVTLMKVGVKGIAAGAGIP